MVTGSLTDRRRPLRARPERATQEPAGHVSGPECEYRAKRNGYLHDKPRLRRRLEDCPSPALYSRQATGYQVTVSSPSRTLILRWPALNRVRVSPTVAGVRGMGAEGRVTSAELHRAASLAPPPPAGLAAYPPLDPELCGGELARSPARANTRAWGRAQRSPLRATTAPPIKGCPPREPPPAGPGPSCAG
jgi:hypothetical protein